MGTPAGIRNREHLIPDASARSVLLTALSVLVYRHDEPTPTAALIDVMGSLGFEPNAVRVALNRTAGAGLVQSTRIGRRSVWSLTDAGQELMVLGEARLDELHQQPRNWDGRLLLLTTNLPSNDRRVANLLRTRLTWLGFGPLAPTTWISLRTQVEDRAALVVDRLGIEAQSFTSRAGRIGDLRDIVRRAWDLDALAADYTTFVDEFGPLAADPGEEPLSVLIRLTHAWRKFPFRDPGLPLSLLPSDWPGIAAANVAASLGQQVRYSAHLHWLQVLDSTGAQS